MAAAAGRRERGVGLTPVDTIVALSSGRPPAAIGVMRVSGPAAFVAGEALAGRLPPPRRAGLRTLRDVDGLVLDRALVLVFPAAASATGEDLVELHCHGGRAVLAAVETALLRLPGLRPAAPGEFTRRALINGRIDLAQAQGLADLLAAETEAQRQLALAASEGAVSAAIRGWLDRFAMISAQVEAALDFAEEGDVAAEPGLLLDARTAAATLRDEIAGVLAQPPVERIKDGIRVVIGGPPNSGKSTLLNALAGREAAIVSPHAGTTRDRVEVPVQQSGIAYLFTDTAGLTNAADPVERIGVARAEVAIATADLLLWLGDEQPPRGDALWLHARADLPGREGLPAGRVLAIRQDRPETIKDLWFMLDHEARRLLPAGDLLPLLAGQREACARAADQLDLHRDPVLAAEQLRTASSAISGVLGQNATEAMLSALFSRFCIGK